MYEYQQTLKVNQQYARGGLIDCECCKGTSRDRPLAYAVHVHVGAGSAISHRLKCYTMRACFMSTVSSTYMYLSTATKPDVKQVLHVHL